MNPLRWGPWALAACLLLPTAAHAADPAVEEVRQCVRKNLPAKTARQEIEIEAFDAGGSQVLRADLFWRRAAEHGDRQEVLVRVEEPADLRGSAFLMLERGEGSHDLFSYLPELQKVRRISGHAISGSLFGTDFSYEDFQRLQAGISETGTKRLPDAEVAGRAAWVVAFEPSPESGSAYRRIVSFVDRETCAVLRTDFEREPGQLAKQLLADVAEVRAVDGRHVPHALVLTDSAKNTRTTVAVRKLAFDVPLKPSLFSEAALTKSR